MGICRLVKQGGHGGYCTTRPLGISLKSLDQSKAEQTSPGMRIALHETRTRIFVNSLRVILEADHLQGVGPGVCALVSSSFSSQALVWAVQFAVTRTP
ncbi:hypothetical protein LA080_000585 [Diaporthe eres]|nr:hypothetical protein LA080_000585 [Diaporthe eres]